MFPVVEQNRKEKVLDGRPWKFDKHLLIIEEMEDNKAVLRIEFTKCPFGSKSITSHHIGWIRRMQL